MPDRARDGARGAARARVADVLVLVGVVAILAAAERAGRSGRVLARERSVVRCDAPAAALDAWRRAGVRGRTLAHFTRRIAVDPEGPPSDGNFVRHAIEEGIVRRVVHVVPDRDWPEAERNLRALPTATAAGRAFHVQWQGTAIDVVRLADLPDSDEPLLADVETDRWTAAELAQIAARLALPPAADVVAWFGAASAFPPGGPGAAAR